MAQKFSLVYSDPSSQNLDGEGVYSEYIADDLEGLGNVPTTATVNGGPRPGSLTLCMDVDGHGKKALYALKVARTWDFVREVV